MIASVRINVDRSVYYDDIGWEHKGLTRVTLEQGDERDHHYLLRIAASATTPDVSGLAKPR